MNTKDFLVVFDVPSIKSYVFGTDKLVEIRGGSGLLDYLNRKKMHSVLESDLGSENVECIYAGGGAGQFILTGTESAVQKSLKKLHHTFRDRTNGGLSLKHAVVELEGDYAGAKNRAFAKLRTAREEVASFDAPSFHSGLIRECDSCSGSAAQRVRHGGESRILCPVCARKVEHGQSSSLLETGFARFLEERGWEPEDARGVFPQTFEDVGRLSRTRGRQVAVVYADGNSMGRLVKAIDNKKDFSFFSDTVDSCIREACHEALLEICMEEGKGQIPALILLLGGDDLLVYMAAEHALGFARDAADRFEQKTRDRFASVPFFRERLGDQGLTISLGIAFGKTHTPFSILLSQAEELLKSAKKKGADDPQSSEFRVPAYIDYHVSNQFSQIRISDCRRDHYSITGPDGTSLRLTGKPYSLQMASDLFQHASMLVQSGIPRSRLKRLAGVPAMGRVRATLEFYDLLSRTRGKHQGKLRKTLLWEALAAFGCELDSAPWIRTDSDTWTTMLGDLIELTEFTTRQGGDHAPA